MISAAGTRSRVSVVVPVYNGARYLGEALESLFAQRYPALEVVVVDDGSTDDTHAVIAPYAGRLIAVHQPNRGQAAALNTGWARSTGEILSYLSADDRLRPDAVATAIEALAAHPEAVAIYGDYGLMGPDSEQLAVVRAPRFDYRRMVASATGLPGPGAFVRRDAHSAVGPWNESLHQIPDLDYWIRLGLHGAIVHVPVVLADFREHEASATFRAPSHARAEEPVAVYERFFARTDLPPDVRSLRRQAVARAHILAARAHLRASRTSRALAHLGHTARTSPLELASPQSLRLLASGVVGAWRHRRRWRSGR